MIERFESRVLMSIVTFTAAGNSTDFNDPGNWDSYQVPGTGDVARFDASGPYTVTLPSSVNVYGIQVESEVSFALSNNAKITASSSFELDGGQLDISGSGTFSINATSGGSYGATIGVSGTFATIVNINADLGQSGNFGTTINDTGGTVNFTSTQHLAGLNIASSGTVTMATNLSNTPQFLRVNNGFSVDPYSKLDLANNDLLIDPAGSNPSVSAIGTLIASAYDNGKFDGNGIFSSAAAASPLHALGYLQNNQSGTALYSSFEGETVDPAEILVKYSYIGDANLDGLVDGSDYTRIDNGFHNHLTNWANGDFNYDGIINGSDYTLIDNAFNTQGASLAATIALPAVTLSTSSRPLIKNPSAINAPAQILFQTQTSISISDFAGSADDTRRGGKDILDTFMTRKNDTDAR